MSATTAVGLRALAAGDVITVPVLDAFEPMMVMRPCDAVAVGYYCAPCRLHVANRGNLEMHLERAGDHAIARWCSRHRLYEAVATDLITDIHVHRPGEV